MINLVDTLFDELYKGFKDLIKKNTVFKGKLKSIEAKLEALNPLIRDMVKNNEALDRSRNELKDLTEVMKSGTKLTVKCSKSRKWEVYRRYKYANKLTEWEERLQSMLDIVEVQISRDVKEIAREVKENAGVAKENAGVVKEIANRLKNVQTSVENIEEKLDPIVIQNQGVAKENAGVLKC